MSINTKSTVAEEEAMPELVPKLRFPEFRDGGEWEIRFVSKLAKVTTGAKDTQNKVECGRYPFFVRSQTIEHIDSYSYDGEAVLTSGDGVGVGKNFHYINGKFDFHQRVYCIYDFDEGVSGLFFYLYFSEHFGERVMRMSAKNSVDSVRMAMITEMPITMPSLCEQKKIADCLSSVDELIAAQTQKVDALKTHKKGLMQQLFPREGETQSRLRFPAFRDAGEWVPKRLEDITSAVFDGTHQTPTYTSEGVPFYSVENLISGNANKFISREDYLMATKKNRPEKGDILLTRIGKIGYSQVVSWAHEFSVYVTLAVIKQSKAFNSYFLGYFMQSEFYQSELRARSLPNAVPPKINLDSLRATGVLLTNADEQQRIADCLTSLDDLIAAQNQKLEVLKIHKKGLMQQLFPSSEEFDN
jgi:type I restriction enzyme S subunit